jgi:hypothetical protein
MIEESISQVQNFMLSQNEDENKRRWDECGQDLSVLISKYYTCKRCGYIDPALMYQNTESGLCSECSVETVIKYD